MTVGIIAAAYKARPLTVRPHAGKSPRSEALREERIFGTPHLSIRELAWPLGLTAEQVSALENGRATMDEADWERLFAGLRAVRCEKEIDAVVGSADDG